MNVSILIPCFNASRFIIDTLDSAINNMEPGDEIVLVDDHSTDDSLSKATCFLRGTDVPHQIVTNTRKGGCAARNLALHLSKGSLIQWLDADDLLGSAKLTIQRQHLHQGGKALVVSPFQTFVEKPNESEANKECGWLYPSQPSPADWLASENKAVIHCWLGNREVFETAGLWDTSLQVNQDGEYFARALAAANQLHVETRVQAFYRKGISGSVSQFTAEKAPSLFKSIQAIQKTALSVEDSPRMRQMISNRWQHFIYTTFPHAPELRRQAQRRLKELPRPTLSNPQTVSKSSQFFSRIFGWKALMRIRQIRGQI